jgi:hypothetical protein
MREFDTGATRDTDDGKLDYEGFLSPLVLHRFAQYMNQHRVQADGGLRDADNWQKGMPLDVYMKSLFRHFMDLWAIHRGADQIATNADTEEVLCAIMFNVMGYLFSVLKDQEPQSMPAQAFSFVDPAIWEEPDTIMAPDAVVTVKLSDLVKVLGEAEGFIGGKDNPEFYRLAEAAGTG